MNPEALEAFKKFVQRKGFSLEDVFTPEQTGEGPALWHPPGPLCVLFMPRVPPSIPSRPSPAPPWGDISAVTGHREPRGAPLWVSVTHVRAAGGEGSGPLCGASSHSWLCLGLYRKLQA